jgi:hypothetical protein
MMQATKSLLFVNGDWWMFEGLDIDDHFEVYPEKETDEEPWVECGGVEIKGRKLTQVMFA